MSKNILDFSKNDNYGKESNKRKKYRRDLVGVG